MRGWEKLKGMRARDTDRQTDSFLIVASESLKPIVVLRGIWRDKCLEVRLGEGGLFHTRKKNCFVLSEKRDRQKVTEAQRRESCDLTAAERK